MIIGMNKALGDIPVTVKLRTGVKDGRNTAHKLMPRLSPEWGVGAVTVGKLVLLLSSVVNQIARKSCTDGRVSNAIPSSQTGNTSSNVWMPYVLAKQTRAAS